MLADRLRRLETLGLVSRDHGQHPHQTYRLTAVGEGLMATLGSLRVWADTWLPDDPDMLGRDPDVVLGWLAQRADPDHAPRRPAVLEIQLHHRRDRRYWLVLQRGVEPYGCLTDPLLDESRYVYLELRRCLALLAVAAGQGDLVGPVRGRIDHGRWRSRSAQQGGRVVRARPGTTSPRLPHAIRPIWSRTHQTGGTAAASWAAGVMRHLRSPKVHLGSIRAPRRRRVIVGGWTACPIGRQLTSPGHPHVRSTKLTPLSA